jgi:hypothetical protein
MKLPVAISLLWCFASVAGSPAVGGERDVAAIAKATEATGKSVSELAQNEPFRAPEDLDVDEARQRVRSELATLRERLKELPLGVSIGEQLKLDALEGELAAQRANLPVLEDCLRRLRRVTALPELPSFAPLRKALSTFVAGIRVTEMQDAAERYEQVIRQLVTAVDTFGRSGSDEAHAEIAEAYAWLARYQQAPATRAWIARRFARPNFLLEAGTDLLRVAETVKIDRDLDIDQRHQGFYTTGKGEATGDVAIEYVPNATAGQLRVRFQGQADCQVKSRKRRVSVWGRMLADFQGEQDFLVTSQFKSEQSAFVDVDCTYRPRAARVAARCRAMSNVMQQVALRVARKKRPEIEQTSAREVKKMVVPEIDRVVDEQLQRANGAIAKQLFEPLDAVDIQPLIQTRTSRVLFSLQGTVAASDQLAARRPANFDATINTAVRVHAHESLFDNLAVMIEGMELDPADFRHTLGDVFGIELETEIASGTESGYLQVIQFADNKPLEVRFRDGLMVVTLRLQAYGDGQQVYRDGPWEVRAAYQVTVQDAQLSLRRTNPIEIEPASGPRVAGLRSVVSGIFFESGTTSDFAAMGQALQRIKLKLSSVQVSEQWITLCLDVANGPSEIDFLVSRDR